MTTTADIRDRWRMGPEARTLTLISAVLTAFGLAVLYSSSAFVATNTRNGESAFFLFRQLGGVGIGIIAFAIAAKLDADRYREWAWPLMWFTIACMVGVLVLPEKLAPTIHGSRRFLVGASFQPSDLGKLSS